MLAYVDTSVFLSIIFEEEDYQKLSDFLNEFSKDLENTVITSHLTLCEVLSALNREKFNFEILGLISERSVIKTYDVQEQTLKEVLTVGHLRGADLYHVAQAFELRALGSYKEQANVYFATRDIQQQKVAAKLGFKTL